MSRNNVASGCARGINDRIMHRSHTNQAELPYWQRRRNALASKVRAPVEGVFVTLKRSYGYWRTRYMGLEKNATEATFKVKVMRCNLRRADRLCEERATLALA